MERNAYGQTNGEKRILMLFRLFMQQTDEEHPLSTSEIITYFGENDIVTDRRTVKADAELLALDMMSLRCAAHRICTSSVPVPLNCPKCACLWTQSAPRDSSHRRNGSGAFYRETCRAVSPREDIREKWMRKGDEYFNIVWYGKWVNGGVSGFMMFDRKWLAVQKRQRKKAYLYRQRWTNQNQTNTYYFSGGFAVRVWIWG